MTVPAQVSTSAPFTTHFSSRQEVPDDKPPLISSTAKTLAMILPWPALTDLFNIDSVRAVLLEHGFVPKTYKNSIWHTAGAWMLSAVLCSLMRSCSKEQMYYYYRFLCDLEGVEPVSFKTMSRAMKQEAAVSAAIRNMSLSLAGELSKEVYGNDLNTLGRQLLDAVNKFAPEITRIMAGDGSDRPLAREKNEGETKGTTMPGRKAHSIMDLVLGVIVYYIMGSSVSNEREALISMITNDPLAAGTLYLLDAGYLSKEVRACIIRVGAYYLIKARKSINVPVVRAVEYDCYRDENGIYQIADEGREVPLNGSMKVNELREKGLISYPVTGRDGYLTGKSYVLIRADGTKILMVFNPENKSFKKDETNSCWVYFETNLSDAFNVRIMSVLYRPRWQIEIKFLCHKSHGGMDCGKYLKHHSSDFFVSASMIADCIKMYIALMSSYCSESLESRKNAVLTGTPSKLNVDVSSKKTASRLSLDALFYILCNMPTGSLVSPRARRHGTYRFRSIADAVKPGRVSSLAMSQGKSLRSTIKAVESYAQKQAGTCTGNECLPA